MPNYDYKKTEECSVGHCERHVELYHSTQESVHSTYCGVCDKLVKVTKHYGSVPVHYKGSGFYVNDYKKADSELRKKYYPRSDEKKYY